MNELQPQQNNNSCLDRGLLVSLRDGELTPEETEKAQAHLALCPDCAADARGMQTASLEVYNLLTVLGPSMHEIPDTKLALSAVQARLDVQNRVEESHATVPSSAQSKIRFFQARKPQHPGRWWIAVAAAARMLWLSCLKETDFALSRRWYCRVALLAPVLYVESGL